jgi:hypothetical protein
MSTNREPQHKYFVIGGKVYDLREWFAKHPGGATWFSRANGRDISVAVHAFHRDPARLQQILARYEVKVPESEAYNPWQNLAGIPHDADLRRFIPRFRWSGDDFLARLRQLVGTPEMRREIAAADRAFDVVGALLLAAHVAMMFAGVYYDVLPMWGFVLFFVVTRTALSGVGHYHCHRKKDGIADWGDVLFDFQYLGNGTFMYDGHVMLHHMYTLTPLDVKPSGIPVNFVPRLWRLLAFPLHRFGQMMTGGFLRWVTFLREPRLPGTAWPALKHLQYLLVHALLVAEFYFCAHTGHLDMWAVQFLVCVWFNACLVLATHDFEQAAHAPPPSEPEPDWAIHQIRNTVDMSFIGVPWIDCFLTAGLGSHRVHHVLPMQGSGFGDIVTEPAVRKCCEEFDVPWLPKQNFVLDRLPKVVGLLAVPMERRGEMPPRPGVDRRVAPPGLRGFLRENFAPRSLIATWTFVVLGFAGFPHPGLPPRGRGRRPPPPGPAH